MLDLDLDLDWTGIDLVWILELQLVTNEEVYAYSELTKRFNRSDSTPQRIVVRRSSLKCDN
jgi:hypothetical protein